MRAAESSIGRRFARGALLAVVLVVSTACSEPSTDSRPTIAKTSLGVTISGCTVVPERNNETWCSADVGGATNGASSYANGAFALVGRGHGVDLPGDSGIDDPDQMRFVYRELSGDAEVVVKVSSFVGSKGAQAGVMIRASGAPTNGLANRGAGFLRLYVACNDQAVDGGTVCVDYLTPPNEPYFAWRNDSGLPTRQIGGYSLSGAEIGPAKPGGAPGAPVWFRLQRSGNDFSVSRSTDGTVWMPFQNISGGPFFAGSAHVGFYVAAGPNNTEASATFEQVYSGPLRLKFATSWVGATYTRDSTGFMAATMNSFHVRPDGTSYTYNQGAEDGQMVSLIRGDGTVETKWNGSGGVEQGAVTSDGTYVYMAGYLDTCPNSTASCGFVDVFEPNPLKWIARLGFGTNHPVHQFWIPWPTASNLSVGRIGGIAAGTVGGQRRIFVSDLGSLTDENDDRIMVIPGYTDPVQPAGSETTFSFSRPGPSSVDAQGRLWIIRPTVDYPIPRNFTLNSFQTQLPAIECRQLNGTSCGSIMRRSVNVNGVENPAAVATHPTQAKLFVAENGADQNIRIYDTSNLSAAPATFGTNVFSGSTPGLVYDPAAGGAARFSILTGVGVDAQNNLYVASGPAIDVRKFVPNGATWSTESVWKRGPASQPSRLLGVHTSSDFVAFEPTSDGTRLYTAREIYSFDEGSPTGSEWGLRSRTWNPQNEPERVGGIPRVVLISGQRYLFTLSGPQPGRYEVRSAGEQQLNVYRMANEVAVPVMRLTMDFMCHGFSGPDCLADPGCLCDAFSQEGSAASPSLMKLWVDKNGNGLIDQTPDLLTTPADESCADPNDEVTCTVDPLGGLVTGSRPPPFGQGACPTDGTGAEECKNPPPSGWIESFNVRSNGELWLTFTQNGTYGRMKGLWKLTFGAIPGSSVNGYSLALGSVAPARTLYDPPPGMHPNDPLPGDPGAYITDPSLIGQRLLNDLKFDANGRLYAFASGQTNSKYKVLRYDNWMNGDWTPNPNFRLPLLSHYNNNVDFIRSFNSVGPGGYNYYPSFDLAGDKLFVHEWYGSIYVYDANTASFVTRLSAGPEVSAYQAYNGHHALAATRRSTGEYLIASHHASDLRGRALIYRWTPTGELGDTCTQASQCASGFCASGICCQTACTSTNPCIQVSCANLEGTPGTCLAVLAADGTSCNDSDACTLGDSCQSGTCAGSAPAPGASNYCSASCPCSYGGGDCDSTAQCMAGLACIDDVGPAFGMGPATDVCQPSACGANALGSANFCSSTCRCGYGGGDCDSTLQCMPGLTCIENVGPAFRMGAATDVCQPSACGANALGSANFCSAACPCGHGGGDCEPGSPSQCLPGLVCGTDNGAAFGYSATTDVCVPD